MKALFAAAIVFAGFSLQAKTLTATDLLKSTFCKEYSCDDTSPYKNKEGQMAMQMRLAKDPLNLDLLVLLDGANLKTLTFKFTNDDSKVDRKALVSLLTFLLGRSPNEQIVDKIAANAVIKTKKDQLLQNEKVALENLNVISGNVLKKPTVIIEI
ncbi:MAG: hypothetical protein K0R29_1150 [Pseudobdellovibrio sp.]|jgi:hypothetical protein|nr:hypothetical protein [Pseudobdellovibrio sp.]